MKSNNGSQNKARNSAMYRAMCYSTGRCPPIAAVSFVFRSPTSTTTIDHPILLFVRASVVVLSSRCCSTSKCDSNCILGQRIPRSKHYLLLLLLLCVRVIYALHIYGTPACEKKKRGNSCNLGGPADYHITSRCRLQGERMMDHRWDTRL